MEKKSACGCSCKKEEPNAQYIGEAIDIANNEKTDESLVEERVKTENDNPRSDDGPDIFGEN